MSLTVGQHGSFLLNNRKSVATLKADIRQVGTIADLLKSQT